MKYINIVLVALAITGLLFTACDDPIDPDPDFSDSYPAYVELTAPTYDASVDSAATEATLMAQVRIRVALGSTTTVDYEYSGDVNGTGTAEIAAGDLTGPLTIDVSGDAVDGGSTTVTLTGANNGLVVGRENVSNDLSPTSAVITWSK